MKKRTEVVLAGALVAGLGAGGFAAGRLTQMPLAGANPISNAAAPAVVGSVPSFADLAAKFSPTVVNIKVTKIEPAAADGSPFGEDFPFPGFGAPRGPERRQGA